MAFSVQMPALGESVSEGTVTRWLKKEGDTVEVDEPLLEVSTDKVDTEIPSPTAGTLQKIVAEVDETLEIGGELAVIDDGSGSADDSGSEGASDDASSGGQAEPADTTDDTPADDAAPQKPSGGPGGGGEGTEVTMPELGESVTEGTITNWLKSVGDTIEVDEPLVEVSTDKVDTEIPSPVAGTIEKILVDEDDDAEVGADLVVIGDGSGSDDSGSGDSGAEETAEAAASGGEDSASEEEAPAGEEDESAESESAPSSGAPGGGAVGQDVTMPALGESVTEGTVTRWLKSVGEMIDVDEPLLEVSTDKVDTEVPSPVAGTVLEILVQEDEDAEVGAVLAVVGDSSGAAPGGQEPSKDVPAAE